MSTVSMPSTPLSTSSQPRRPAKSTTSKPKSRSDADKENLQDGENDAQEEEENVAMSPAGNSQPLRPNLPSTPVVRIELEDLIGNTEDIFNRPAPLGTPGDHVHWHNGPNSSDVGSAAQTTQRSRKRARSSSPSSSQLERSARFGSQGEDTGVGRPQKSQRTPDNDPTQDLWRRYMHANDSRHPEDETLPNLARLPPSSPTTPNTASRDGGIRRTVSCGIEWPTSKSKRRKVDVSDSHSRTRNIFAASRREILAREVSKTSRVSLLVEKIQESLARQARAEDEPSSSSPLPGRHSQMPLSQASPGRSPSKQRQTREHSAPGSSAPAGPVVADERVDAMLEDFDDDGLDLEFFEEVEKGMSQVAVSQKPVNNADDITKELAPSAGAIPAQQHQAAHTQPELESTKGCPGTTATELAETNFDGFFDDDDDEDVFTTEMESRAAKVESQERDNKADLLGHPYETNVRPLTTIPELDGSFDDADDDDLLLQIADDVDHGRTGLGPISQVRADR
jgi:DNA replication ATP-dependent helicase Dna2